MLEEWVYFGWININIVFEVERGGELKDHVLAKTQSIQTLLARICLFEYNSLQNQMHVDIILPNHWMEHLDTMETNSLKQKGKVEQKEKETNLTWFYTRFKWQNHCYNQSTSYWT